ncbi:signal-induced proliferation-associated 1-like protein 1 [Caerostris darwini]|uniref:Signal-induced proliferation-associated 1-like protein 1 n=1 Tax=Caerostris darwini TaxID=1538125 RepID=A0AAV4W6A5_9ARAC|nr:signal-induced proliferation-associated 1-like protein 1 [Caerostris darwini]
MCGLTSYRAAYDTVLPNTFVFSEIGKDKDKDRRQSIAAAEVTLSMCADAGKVDRAKLSQVEFNIIEFDSETFTILMEYLQSGSCPLTCETIPGLICAAEHYDLPELLQACFHHAKQHFKLSVQLVINNKFSADSTVISRNRYSSFHTSQPNDTMPLTSNPLKIFLPLNDREKALLAILIMTYIETDQPGCGNNPSSAVVCSMLNTLENYYWRYNSASELVNAILQYIDTRAGKLFSKKEFLDLNESMFQMILGRELNIPEITKFHAMMDWANYKIEKSHCVDPKELVCIMNRLTRDLKLQKIPPQELIKVIIPTKTISNQRILDTLLWQADTGMYRIKRSHIEECRARTKTENSESLSWDILETKVNNPP